MWSEKSQLPSSQRLRLHRWTSSDLELRTWNSVWTGPNSIGFAPYCPHQIHKSSANDAPNIMTLWAQNQVQYLYPQDLRWEDKHMHFVPSGWSSFSSKSFIILYHLRIHSSSFFIILCHFRIHVFPSSSTVSIILYHLHIHPILFFIHVKFQFVQKSRLIGKGALVGIGSGVREMIQSQPVKYFSISAVWVWWWEKTKIPM